MARVLLILSALVILNYQVKSQIIRSPLSLLNRPFTESIIDASRNYIGASLAYTDAPRNYIDTPRAYADAPRNYIELPIEDQRNYINVPRIVEARNYLQQQPTIIADSPCNGIPVASIPTIPNIPSPATIITDCTPSVCKNIANTINLMIVCDLLQKKGNDQAALQLAAPLLKDIMSNPALPGYPNPISNLVNPNLIAPNVASNFFSQNLIAPNLAASSVFAPNPIAPRLVAPNSISPNAPINNSGLLSSLLKLLGGAA